MTLVILVVIQSTTRRPPPQLELSTRPGQFHPDLRQSPDLGEVSLPKSMTLYDFDDVYTAPRNGFAGAEDYYARSSAGPLIPGIRVPGLVVHSEDDPFIPAEPFYRVTFPSQLALELIPCGGHLGYVSQKPWRGDRRWLEARLTAWLAAHWGARRTRSTGPVA